MNHDPLSKEKELIKISKVVSLIYSLIMKMDVLKDGVRPWYLGYAYILIDIFNSIGLEEKITVEDFKKLNGRTSNHVKKNRFYEMIEIMIGKLKMLVIKNLKASINNRDILKGLNLKINLVKFMQ